MILVPGIHVHPIIAYRRTGTDTLNGSWLTFLRLKKNHTPFLFRKQPASVIFLTTKRARSEKFLFCRMV